MKHKNLKVRIAALSTLSCLALSVQEQLDAHFDAFFPELQKTIDETQSFEPVLNALKVLRRLFRSHKAGTAPVYQKHFTAIKDFLVRALNHEYSKVVGEGLRVSGSFLNALRSSQGGAIDDKFKSVAGDFFTAIANKLDKTDIDIEVKSCSILAAASLVSVCHAALQPAQVKRILDIYSDRLANELTRDAALKGLTMVASNETSQKRNSGAQSALIPLGNLTGFLPAFYDLLKKTHRQLHLNTLECMEALTRRYPDQFKAHVAAIANEISPMVDEQDLQRAILALKVAANLIRISPAPQAHAQVVGMAIQLSSSELIQDQIEAQLKEFFKIASSQKVIDQGAASQLLGFVNIKSTGAAACLAIVVASNQSFAGMLGQFWTMASAQSKPAHQIVGALCLGEYGKIVDLSKEAKIIPTVQGLFQSGEDNVRIAASICLGNVAIGNPDFFLAKVFSLVAQSKDAQKHLFLNTIREIIIHDSGCLAQYIDQLSDLLMSHSTQPDELIRSTVAESLGRLFAVYPHDLIGAIDTGFKTGPALMKATLAKSVKYSGGKCQDLAMLKIISECLVMLKAQAEPEVKKNALDGLTTIVHSNWTVLKDIIGDVEGFAHQETNIRPELIEEVDLGPFKQKRDHGIPMRKAAYGLLEILYDRCADHVDVDKIVDVVINLGMADSAEEILIPNLNILSKLSQRSGVVVLSRVDAVVGGFEKLFRTNLKLVSSKQSQERAMNIIRASLRVVYIINNSAELAEQPAPRFSDFYKNQVLANADSKQMYEKIAASAQSSV